MSLMRSLIGLLKKAFSGLRLRLFVMALLACAPLVALILHAAWEDRRRAETAWQQQLRRVSQLVREEQKQLCDSTRQLLLAVSEAAAARSLKPEPVSRYLHDVHESYPRYANLGLLTTNGGVLASAFPVADADPGRRAFFSRVIERREFAVSTFARGSSNNVPSVYFGYPMLDSSGQIMAVVFAQLDLNTYSRASEVPPNMPRNSTWTELSHEGRILGRYPSSRSETLLGRRPGTNSPLAGLTAKTSGVLEASDRRGMKNFYAFAAFWSPFEGADVMGVLSTPRKVLFADADRTLRRSLSALGLAALSAFLLGWVGSHFLILRPVKALVRSSAQLAAGDLSVRTGLKPSHDELGQLTLSFDQMAQALQERELERQRASKKLQVLSHRLVEVQEAERRQIARELHDEIGQSLTAAELNLQAALQAPRASALEKRLEDSIQAVERVLEQVHDLSLNLRPSMLDDLGLEPALRWYTHRQAALTGMRAEFYAETLDDRLDPVIETECFRVAQEALTNVVRHSQASHVKVELTRRDDRLHLRVRDDGVGFDVSALRDEAVRGASLGLLSMEERASLAGGGLEFNSAPGQGTEVRAWFPLHVREHTMIEQFDE